MNEIWQFEERGIKSQNFKSLEHMVAYGCSFFAHVQIVSNV